MKKEKEKLRVGDIAVSKAGHDAGRLYVVVSELNDDFVLVCDGKYRKSDNPKTKRRKHLVFAAKSGIEDGEAADAAIAGAIKQYRSQEE